MQIGISKKRKNLEENWKAICADHAKNDPEKATLLKRLVSGDLPENFMEAFDNHIEVLKGNNDSIATRKCSQMILEFLKDNYLN